MRPQGNVEALHFPRGGIEGCNNQTEECHFDIWFLLSPIYLLCQKSDYLVTLYDRFWCASRGKIDFGLVVSCLLHIYIFTECGSMRVLILSSLRLESYQKNWYSCYQQKFIIMMLSQYENWKCYLQFEKSYWLSLGMKNHYFEFSFSRFFLQSKDMEIFCRLGGPYNNKSNMLHIFFCSDFILNEAYFFRRFVWIWPTSTSNT